jgi:glycosyltransferase involved in cell wall biosynthesis
LVEALAHGLLPIIREVGGVREALLPELSPWVLPPEADAEMFRVAIAGALALSDEELLAMRDTARESGKMHCDMGRMIDQLEDWLAHEVIHGD